MENQNKNKTKVAIFDLDGTLIKRYLWIGILKHHLRNKENLFWSFWYLTTHLTILPFWKFHLVPTERFYKIWGKDMPMLLKGMGREKTKRILGWVANEYLLPSIKSNVLEKLREHQEQGYLTILTSGSFQNLLDIIIEHLEIDFAVGTELKFTQGRFSGKIVPPLCFSQDKKRKLEKLLFKENLDINFKESFAYSDSIFDLPVLELVGHPIAVEPDKQLRALAEKRNWQII